MMIMTLLQDLSLHHLGTTGITGRTGNPLVLIRVAGAHPDHVLTGKRNASPFCIAFVGIILFV